MRFCFLLSSRSRVAAISVLALALTVVNRSPSEAAGASTAAFLDLPTGAAPAAMGNAYTALATDANAPTWNPGGMSFARGPEVSAMHLNYVESMSYDTLSFARPFHSGTSVGLAVQYFNPGKFSQIDNNGNPQGEFGGNFSAYDLAVGRRISDRFSVGVTGKYLQSRIDTISATGYAFDLGGFWKIAGRWNVGAVLANLGPGMKFIEQTDPLPRAMRLGAAFLGFRKLILSGETVFRQEGDREIHLGTEWRPVDLLSFRVGYRSGRQDLASDASFSAGVGLAIFDNEISYAWLPMGELGATQSLSFTYRFGAKKESSGVTVASPVTEATLP